MFTFEVKLDDNDYFEFSKSLNLNSAVGKKALLTYRLIVPIISVLTIFVFWIAGAKTGLLISEVIGLAILSVVFIILAKPFYIKSLRKQLDILKKNGKLPYNKEATLLFSDDYCTEITLERETKIKYSVVERVVETEKAIYVYMSAVSAAIIPLKCFSDDAQKQQFICFIQSKINANR